MREVAVFLERSHPEMKLFCSWSRDDLILRQPIRSAFQCATYVLFTEPIPLLIRAGCNPDNPIRSQTTSHGFTGNCHWKFWLVSCAVRQVAPHHRLTFKPHVFCCCINCIELIQNSQLSASNPLQSQHKVSESVDFLEKLVESSIEWINWPWRFEWNLWPNAWSDRLGPKQLWIEHWKIYKLICKLIKFA